LAAGSTASVNLQNTTAATASTVNASGTLNFQTNIWTSSLSVQDQWTMQSLSASSGTEPVSELQVFHLPGSTATPAFVFGLANYVTSGVQNSMQVYLSGAYQSQLLTSPGFDYAADSWVFQTQVGAGLNGTSTLNINHVGTSGATYVSVSNFALASSAIAQSSPTLQLVGQYWTGATSAADTWSIQDVVGNGTNGSSVLTFTHSGTAGTAGLSIPLIVNYGGTATVSQGVPSEIVTIDLTAQSAAITSTNIIASAPRSGMYRVSWSADITTAASGGTPSSTLGGANGFQVSYTSPTDSVSKTTVAGNSITSAANTTGTAVGGTLIVYAKTGTAITYTYGYTSAGTTSMVYELHIKLEAL
jgi:hypothetical protein